MKAHHLKRLSEAAELARIDLNKSGPLTIAPNADGEGIIAWYQGAYGGCGVLVPSDDAISPVAVQAIELQTLAGIFDDTADVVISNEPSTVEIVQGRRRVSLRLAGVPDADPYYTARNVPPLVRVRQGDLDKLVRAAGMVAAATMSAPILTGIRLIAGRGQLGAQASNGTSLVFEGSTPAECLSDEFEAIVPSADLTTMIPVLGGGADTQISIGLLGKTAVFHSEDAVIRLPTLGGAWPNLSGALRRNPVIDRLTIPTATVRSLSVAVRAYDAAPEILFDPSGDVVVIRTSESEAGQFEETVAGPISRPYRFAVSDLEVAARIADDEINMALQASVGVVTCGKLRLYMLVR